MSGVFFEVKDLTARFGHGPKAVAAVSDVSFTVERGQVLGLVGESGSGKSVTLRSIIGLTRRTGAVTGRVLWQGRDILQMSERDLGQVRGREIAMIFQEPMSSLNPLLTVGRQIDESLRAHTDLDARTRRARAVELLAQVGIPAPAGRLGDYPHQFSGGMRQRAMIAIALAAGPRLLLADEPTTALDVTIQAQILDLILRLASEMDMGVILVTRDLGVVAQSCDEVAVMYAGRIVETGAVRRVLREPRHPYTKGLMQSVPEGVAPRSRLFSIPGSPPALSSLPKGCAFAPRCALADGACAVRPPLVAVSDGTFACHHSDGGTP